MEAILNDARLQRLASNPSVKATVMRHVQQLEAANAVVIQSCHDEPFATRMRLSTLRPMKEGDEIFVYGEEITKGNKTKVEAWAFPCAGQCEQNTPCSFKHPPPSEMVARQGSFIVEKGVTSGKSELPLRLNIVVDEKKNNITNYINKFVIISWNTYYSDILGKYIL